MCFDLCSWRFVWCTWFFDWCFWCLLALGWCICDFWDLYIRYFYGKKLMTKKIKYEGSGNICKLKKNTVYSEQFEWKLHFAHSLTKNLNHRAGIPDTHVWIKKKLCQTAMFSYFIRALVMETECRKKTTSLGDDALIALIAVIDRQLGYRQIVFR